MRIDIIGDILSSLRENKQCTTVSRVGTGQGRGWSRLRAQGNNMNCKVRRNVSAAHYIYILEKERKLKYRSVFPGTNVIKPAQTSSEKLHGSLS